MELQNVFVSYSGLCIDERGLVKESHHNYPEMLEGFINEVNYFYNDTLKHPENLITLNGKDKYLLIHHSWSGNYYHWLCEAILRIWVVKDTISELTLILPEIGKNHDFVMSSLEPFQFKNIFYVPPNKSLRVENLCMPQMKPVVDSYFKDILKDIGSFYRRYALKIKGIDLDLGERIYISREKAQRKKIVNECDFESLLTKFNFKIINNEDYSFWEQVAIYSKAKYLISIHGSGLTNMLFMCENSSVLEFHKRITNEKDWHSRAFWYQADALDFNYYQQVCDPTDIMSDYFNANLIVDITTFEKNLKEMLFVDQNC